MARRTTRQEAVISKFLKTAALVVGAVALVATGIGAAAGAGLLGATALGTTTAVGTVFGVSVATITSVGVLAGVAAGALSLAAGLTAKKPTAADATGSPTTFSADPDDGMPLALGRTGNAGQIIYRKEFDTADAGVNDRQAFVAALSIGPIAAVEGMTVDRSAVSFASGAALGAFAGFMWSMTQIGALPEPALGFGAGAGTPTGWTSAHRLSGLAAASWTLKFDTKSKLYQNGVPAPMWTVKGALAYDPRKDSTYPGGSGAHRMADPADTAAYDAAVATWEWTEDPYLLGLRWAHGFWQRDLGVGGSTWSRVMGMGAPQGGIDVASFVEGANIAQANGWTCGGMIYSGDDKWDSLKKILQAGMGEPLALGAKISCLVNAPKVSLATITVDDVVGDASVTATQPRRDRINTVTPRYRLEANNWELLPGAPITVAEYVVADRGKRSKLQDYPFIQQTPQVGTAVRYDIENAREFGPIVLPLKLVWMGYKPGDCVTATLPEVGLNTQPVLLLNRSLDPSGGIVTMTARSETTGKHAFALGQSATPPPTPAVTGPALVPVPGAAAWSISATSLTSSNATLPALVVTGAVDVGTAETIVFEYRPFVSGQAAGVNWRAAGVEKPETTRIEIVSVQAGTSYEVAVSYRARGVTGGRRILGPITTAGFLSAQAQSAIDAAAAAQTLAAGKTQYWIQATPPSAAESGDNDAWISTIEGNRPYQRIPGTGRLAIGGNRITIGGNTILLRPWKPADDARFAAALLAAAGAQATADGKVFVFKQEATPTAFGVGDLWYQDSTGQLRRWSGTSWDATADATALNQHSVPAIPDVHINASYAGTTSAGQLPAYRFAQHLLGSSDVSPQAGVSASATGGVAIAVNNTIGDAQRGLITINAGQNVPALTTITGVSSYGGVDAPFSFQVVRDDAPLPANPGSGSGGTASGAANANVTTAPHSASSSEMARTMAVTTGSGGSVTISCPVTYYEASEGGFADESSVTGASMTGQLQYSTNAGSTWTNAGSAVTGGLAKAWFKNTLPGKGAKDNPSSMFLSATVAGLGSGASVLTRVLGSSANGGDIATVEGTLTANPS